MNAPIAPAPPRVVYPDSDGQPMSDNTLQWECIVTIKCGLDVRFRDDPNVFVAGDLLWYAVEGYPTIRAAPDALVAFGRPKGYRGSYQQWLEDNIPPQVVFEVLSPGNRVAENLRKFQFYQYYGVEEYYIYDPYENVWSGWMRAPDGQLHEVADMEGWVSPRLGVRFSMKAGDLELYHPDGRRFTGFIELTKQWEAEKQARALAEQAASQARAQAAQAEQARAQAEQATSQERERAERLAAQLRAAGIEPQD
jgi:Uma2 family endonuclease